MSVWTMDYKIQVTIRIYILMVNAVFNYSSILSTVHLKMCRKHSSKSNNMKVCNINTKFIFTYCAREGTEKTWSYPVTCISAILKKRKQEEMLKCNNIIVTTYIYQKLKLKKYYHTRNTKLNRFWIFASHFHFSDIKLLFLPYANLRKITHVLPEGQKSSSGFVLLNTATDIQLSQLSYL